MRKFLLALAVLSLCCTVQAQTAQLDKAARISKAIGIEGILIEARASSLTYSKQQIEMMMNQLRTAGVSQAELEKMAPSLDRLVTVLSTSWDPQIATQIFAEGLVGALSDRELDVALKYYSSPEGEKTNGAILASQRKMMEFVQSQYSSALELAMASFYEEMKRVTAIQRKE